MEIGLYGLGRMGGNMVRRLVQSGEHRVVAGNRSSGPVDQAVQDGADGAYSMEELVEKLSPPRTIWTTATPFPSSVRCVWRPTVLKGSMPR